MFLVRVKRAGASESRVIEEGRTLLAGFHKEMRNIDSILARINARGPLRDPLGPEGDRVRQLVQQRDQRLDFGIPSAPLRRLRGANLDLQPLSAYKNVNPGNSPTRDFAESRVARNVSKNGCLLSE